MRKYRYINLPKLKYMRSLLTHLVCVLNIYKMSQHQAAIGLGLRRAPDPVRYCQRDQPR